MKVHYRFRKKGTKTNPHQLIVIPGWHDCLERICVHRGFSLINCEFTLTREMTAREVEAVKYSFRADFIKYFSWHALIIDEVDLLGEDHPFVEQLREISKEHPYTISQQTTLNL